MEYNNWFELYKELIPVFNVKRRLLNNTIYKDIKNEDIWKYLAINKWKNSTDLTLSEIINDIICFDVYSINNNLGGK